MMDFEKRNKNYKERFVDTPLGNIRVYFGYGRRPAPREVTFSKHKQEHTICFSHYGCRVQITCNKDARCWSFNAEYSFNFRGDETTAHCFHMEFKRMTAEDACKIGEQLAEMLAKGKK
jgi:hypothetical protein